MHTNWCVLIEISMEIWMLNFCNVITYLLVQQCVKLTLETWWVRLICWLLRTCTMHYMFWPSLDLLCSISLMTFSIFSLVVQMESLCPSQFCLAFSKFIFRNAFLLSSILPKRNEKIQPNHRLLDLDGRNSQKYLHQT